ncbi:MULTISPECIES: 3'-5' exoribonuclease [unclassified Pseudomonas]|uniref:3'-5' exonuclease n=1 Tax=unclassified Pseudomonas TaxID=196821 RepID=UPI002449AC6A|nr:MULTISPECIES: 3'-5' exoribonuclease [unclassified Pseudomonas]MDG9928501.1 3'-5' exoribonuclease [Pseudomonas sp. GD04042]MDH0482671.1 3'-5' exoribonuclease [Pseudomonas sp. GD04015]MDH0604627.1 3'-5' exoribonuclease [Pseudomonas sp. GD03869]
MINQTHFILDLETMGNRPTSAIVAIGCVRIENLQITDTFYRHVDLQSSLSAGLTVDAGTINWWLRQSREAQEAITSPEPVQVFEALLDLCEFMGAVRTGEPNRQALLWGNGSSFDNVIIGSAFDAHNIERPWMFWNDRDLRTLLALYPEAETLPFEGIKHHALDDAKHEARQLIMALQLHQKAQQGVPA